MEKPFDHLKKLELGFPVTIKYGRNLKKAPYFGVMYAQDIEPAGEYMFYHDTHYQVPNYEYGTITFYNPLILEHITTAHGGWKTTLSKKYRNRRRKKLTEAVIQDGYDAIITIDSEQGCFKEIVNFNGIKSNVTRT